MNAMDVSALSNSQSWEHFIRLTQAARIRNESFSSPAEPASRVKKNGGIMTAPRGADASAGLAPYTRPAQATQGQNRQILGMHFDAYA